MFRRVLREQQLDVIVRAEADKTGQLRAAQGNAAHARGQVDHAKHFQTTALDLVHDTVDGLRDHFSHALSPGQVEQSGRRQWLWRRC
ncbi:hypothetical protein D3C85_1534060 [compost metagenome]